MKLFKSVLLSITIAAVSTFAEDSIAIVTADQPEVSIDAQGNATVSQDVDVTVMSKQEFKDAARVALKTVARDIYAQNIIIKDSAKAAEFWKLYNLYEQERTPINRDYIKLVSEYADNFDQLSEVKADELVKRLNDVMTARQDLLMDTYKKISKKVDKKTAAQFVQISNRLNLLLDLKIASAVPMIFPEGMSISADGAMVPQPTK